MRPDRRRCRGSGVSPGPPCQGHSWGRGAGRFSGVEVLPPQARNVILARRQVIQAHSTRYADAMYADKTGFGKGRHNGGAGIVGMEKSGQTLGAYGLRPPDRLRRKKIAE